MVSVVLLGIPENTSVIEDGKSGVIGVTIWNCFYNLRCHTDGINLAYSMIDSIREELVKKSTTGNEFIWAFNCSTVKGGTRLYAGDHTQFFPCGLKDNWPIWQPIYCHINIGCFLQPTHERARFFDGNPVFPPRKEVECHSKGGWLSSLVEPVE